MLESLVKNLILKVMDVDGWDLAPEVYVATLGDYLAAKGLSPDRVEIAPVHADGISLSWLGMYRSYQQFNTHARKYDAVTDFREYPGERWLFGLIREWRMEGTGIRIRPSA